MATNMKIHLAVTMEAITKKTAQRAKIDRSGTVLETKNLILPQSSTECERVI